MNVLLEESNYLWTWGASNLLSLHAGSSYNDPDPTSILDLNPTLGLILYTDKNDAVVKYTLGPEQEKKIFGSRYQLCLPTKADLKAEIRREIKPLRAYRDQRTTGVWPRMTASAWLWNKINPQFPKFAKLPPPQDDKFRKLTVVRGQSFSSAVRCRRFWPD